MCRTGGSGLGSGESFDFFECDCMLSETDWL